MRKMKKLRLLFLVMIMGVLLGASGGMVAGFAISPNGGGGQVLSNLIPISRSSPAAPVVNSRDSTVATHQGTSRPKAVAAANVSSPIHAPVIVKKSQY